MGRRMKFVFFVMGMCVVPITFLVFRDIQSRTSSYAPTKHGVLGVRTGAKCLTDLQQVVHRDMGGTPPS